ncbi:MAG TPA: arsenic resistance N-acetyltransferase ArsN2 [Chitinophagaceae bacterium]|nr:arsenic resistance N-acetyltransferase ArsN2 [Chitinophagaceae bacterium]
MISSISIHHLEALQLLKQNNLPVDDLSASTELFAIQNDGAISGLIGIELYASTALIRSFVVRKEERDKGIGKKLIHFIEEYARDKRVMHLFLITTTAGDYFSNMEYRAIDRADVPEEIRASTEFSTTCPATALVMTKSLHDDEVT